MIKEALQYLVGVVQSEPTKVVKNIEYWLSSEKPVEPPYTNEIAFPTLAGLCDYITTVIPHNNAVEKKLQEIFFVVAGYNGVDVHNAFYDNYDKRALLATSSVNTSHNCSTKLNFALSAFINWLKTETVIRDGAGEPLGSAYSLIDALSNIVIDDKTNFSDTGSSQTINRKAGISGEKAEEIPNPVALYPYRTFIDVDQPGSEFFIRLKYTAGQDSEPVVILTLADGGILNNTIRPDQEPKPDRINTGRAFLLWLVLIEAQGI